MKVKETHPQLCDYACLLKLFLPLPESVGQGSENCTEHLLLLQASASLVFKHFLLLRVCTSRIRTALNTCCCRLQHYACFLKRCLLLRV